VRFFCVDSNCDLFDQERQSRITSLTNIFLFQQTNKKKTDKLEILVARVKTSKHDSKDIPFLNQKKQEILAM
jgi:ABC-type enterochelin transport system substrate-binding protein